MYELVQNRELEERTVIALAAAAVVALVAITAVSVMPTGDAWVGVTTLVSYYSDSLWAPAIIGVYGAGHASMWSAILGTTALSGFATFGITWAIGA